MLAATVVTLSLGYALKQPCAAGDWSNGRQYRQLCYSDVVALYGSEQLQGGRLPYLDACRASTGQCDEYPVLTMYLMRAASSIAARFGATYAAFFNANVVLLGILALAISWALYRMAGNRAVYFALAPTLLIYGFMNWDLLAVALATLATVAYLRDRDGWSGVLLGLGAAAKAYPALLVVPFVIGRLRRGERGRAAAIAGGAAAAWLATNLPFALAAPHSWATFFRFNGGRGADWDSLWFVACERLQGTGACSWSSGVLNPASALALVVLAGIVWAARQSRDPDFPAWTFGFPLVALFLLTNKVYSPQYGLWLLPWFALTLPDARLFVAFEAADVAVFMTRFFWFGRLSSDIGDPAFAGYHGVPLGAFEAAVVVRAAVLVACIVAWVLRDSETHADPALVPSRGTGLPGFLS